ncbi:MAG TPA: DUF222 domain-containing protein, partial [Acidimicrobiia bacterium]|nr:DUF222 domain-containing protein [Acidimicrobiia bacterium]
MFDMEGSVLDPADEGCFSFLDGGIPAGLDTWAPGPFLGDVLESVDRDGLSGYELVALLRAEAAMIAHWQALHNQTLVRILDAEMELFGGEIPVSEVWETTTGEIEAALTLTFRAAQRRLDFAVSLVEDHPRVWKALLAGSIDIAKAHVIIDGLTGTASHIAEEVMEKILEKASEWTTGQIRARLKKLVAEADPAAAVEAYEEGKAERRGVADRNWDGTANLCGWNLPVDRVAEARDRINQIARSLKTRDESRTLDQLRADIFLDLLCGVEHDHESGRKGVVDIRVDLETLAGLTEAPGEIPGFGPVLADITRQIASEHGTQWQITLTHQSQPVWVGTTRRRPTA